jgi:FKBP-type peptidyl-prolyl cis-trans isomerase FkpA
MRKLMMLTMVLALAGCGNPTPKTEEEKTFYALGLSLGRQVKMFNLTPEELKYVQAGLHAQVTGTQTEVDLQTYGPKLSELARTRSMAEANKEKERGKAFLEKAAKEEGATRTESGIVYKSLQEGTGASPGPTDMVRVHYTGTLPDGKEFDSSHKRGEPAQFPLNGVIPCWTEGVQKMKVGGKAQLVCPSELAYGDRGTPGIPGGSVLTFVVELLEVKKNEAPAGMPHGPDDGHGHGAPTK